MAALKQKLGRIPCEGCGHPVVLKKNDTGTLSVSCDECDVSAFAKAGTGAAKRWLAALPAQTQPAPENATEGPPKAPAAPVASKVPKAPVLTAPIPVPPKAAGPFDFLHKRGA
jgi:hypothetical protein